MASSHGKKASLLTFIAAFFFLFGSVVEGAAFQDMTCKPVISTGKEPKTCKTMPLDEGRAKIICGGQPLETNTGLMYDCMLVVRDQGLSTPYAHTSRIWHCTADDFKTYLFNQDFFMDAVRCDLVCGRCEGNWEAAASPR